MTPEFELLLVSLAQEFRRYLEQKRCWEFHVPLSTLPYRVVSAESDGHIVWCAFEPTEVRCGRLDHHADSIEFDYADPQLFEQLLTQLDSWMTNGD